MASTALARFLVALGASAAAIALVAPLPPLVRAALVAVGLALVATGALATRRAYRERATSEAASSIARFESERARRRER